MRIFRIFLDIPLNHVFHQKITDAIKDFGAIEITNNPNQAHFIVQIQDVAISIQMVPTSKIILLGDYSSNIVMVPVGVILLNYRSGNAWHPEVRKWIPWRTLGSEYI